MKYTIDLEWEQVDAIVAKELCGLYDSFAPEKRPACGIWSTDEAEDLKEMRKMRKAISRILSHYGVQL